MMALMFCQMENFMIFQWHILNKRTQSSQNKKEAKNMCFFILIDCSIQKQYLATDLQRCTDTRVCQVCQRWHEYFAKWSISWYFSGIFWIKEQEFVVVFSILCPFFYLKDAQTLGFVKYVNDGINVLPNGDFHDISVAYFE